VGKSPKKGHTTLRKGIRPLFKKNFVLQKFNPPAGKAFLLGMELGKSKGKI